MVALITSMVSIKSTSEEAKRAVDMECIRTLDEVSIKSTSEEAKSFSCNHRYGVYF